MAFMSEVFNSWETTGLELNTLLNFEPQSFRCRPYYGLGHALSDLMGGLKTFWPVKKTIYSAPWGGPYLNELMNSMAQQGYHWQKLKGMGEADGSGILTPASFQNLAQDLLAVVYFRDHALTGSLLADHHCASFLNDKRILHIEIMFGWADSMERPPLPFGAQIRVLNSQKAIVVLGHRFRMAWGSAKVMDWSGFEPEAELRHYQNSHPVDRQLIEAFEQELVATERPTQRPTQMPTLTTVPTQRPTPAPAQGPAPTPMSTQRPSPFTLYPHPFKERLFDRSAFYVRGINGDFFIESLLEKMGEQGLAPSGREVRCETTQLSRWGGLMPCSWWGEVPLTDEEQRTLVILSSAFLKRKAMANFLKDIKEVYAECSRQISNRGE